MRVKIEKNFLLIRLYELIPDLLKIDPSFGFSFVNSGEKFETSSSSLIDGINGGLFP